MNFLRSEPGTEPVLLEAFYDANPETVFAAWTEPEQVMHWYCPAPAKMKSAAIDLRVGGKWCFDLDDPQFETSSLEGTYLEIVAPRLLVFDWCHTHGTGENRRVTMMSKVTLRLRAENSGTRIHLRQEKLANPDYSHGVGAGWNAAFTQLGQYLTP